MTFCRENATGRASLIQGGEFLNLFNDCQFLIKGSAPLKVVRTQFSQDQVFRTNNEKLKFQVDFQELYFELKYVISNLLC